MQKIIETKYFLDEKDIKTVLLALHYAYHRLTTEPLCGAKCMNKEEVRRLLEEFKKEK